jgi:hypothetical protein
VHDQSHPHSSGLVQTRHKKVVGLSNIYRLKFPSSQSNDTVLIFNFIHNALILRGAEVVIFIIKQI